MATMHYLSGSLLILVLGMGGGVGGHYLKAVIPSEETGGASWGVEGSSECGGRIQDDARKELRKTYTTEIGVHEATGHNDGKRVEEYLQYRGLGAGYNWCSAFTCWCLGRAGIPNPKNPWAPAMFPAKRVVKVPQAGDIFGLYFPELKRIGHCGFIDACDGKWITTVEGNSDNAVVRKKRLLSTIYKVADWVSP